MHAIYAWCLAHPWAVASYALIVSLLAYNGLAAYPKTQGAARYLHFVIDLLSPFVRKNSAGVLGTVIDALSAPQNGTLKLPLLQRSAPPNGVSALAASADRLGRQGGYASLRLLLVLLPLTTLCMAAQCGPYAKRVGIDVAACALGKVPDVLAPLIPDVLKALQGTAVEWAGFEADLIMKGIDIAVCSISAAIAELSKPGQALSPAAQVALDRAQVSLARLGVL